MNKHFTPAISEEKFAAWLDGMLPADEMREVEYIIMNDDVMFHLYTTSREHNPLSNDFSSDIVALDMLNEDTFSLPSIIDMSEVNQFVEDDKFEINTNNLNSESMSKTPNSGSRIYGEQGENIYDPIFIQQPDDHSCALRSQQIVLRDFGIDIPFEDLERIALEAGVYTEHGTYTCDIGKVLEMAGVGMHQVSGSTIYDLTNELAQGHRVIVSVDANELWYDSSVKEKMTNWLDDVFGNQGGNHALIVAGVEVNPDDPSDVKVVLTDPGAGHLRIEYPLDQFMDAWQDSNCFMAATDDAAPYQYDAHTGMEVPSNFYSQFAYNQFIATNSYQLNPDMINIPEGYQAAYNGHLDMLGNVEYEDFDEGYKQLVSARETGTHSQVGIETAVNSLIGDLKDLFGHHHIDENDVDPPKEDIKPVDDDTDPPTNDHVDIDDSHSDDDLDSHDSSFDDGIY